MIPRPDHAPTPSNCKATLGGSEPIFLVGSLRSGTTLLRLILDAHSAIHWPNEFEFAVARNRGRDWQSGADFAEFLAGDRMFQDSGLALPTPTTHADDLAHRLLEQYAAAAAAFGKPVLGLTIHANFDRALHLWPNARFIHLLRDPRDVANSVVQMGWAGNVYAATDYWRTPELAWERMAATLPADRHIEVHYERLLQQPAQELERLCTFLGVTYEPGMLDFHHAGTYPAIDRDAAFRWRTKMPAHQVQWVEARCGELMESRGYPLSGLPRTVTSRLGRAALWVDHRCRRAVMQARRLGIPLWLDAALAQRIGGKGWRRRVQALLNAAERAQLR